MAAKRALRPWTLAGRRWFFYRDAVMDRLRVLTLNVWNRSGPWDTRRELVRAALAELKPDVVGLQEIVGDATDATQAHEIARGLLVDGASWHVAFGPAQAWGPVSFGNAILSRWPIRETVVTPLPITDLGTGADIADPRAVLLARIDTPWGDLPFHTTHLSWKFHEGYAREAQVLAVVAHVEATRRAGALPDVVVGDFNAQPDAAEIRFMTGLQTLARPGTTPRGTYFADAFAWAGEGAGATFDRARNPYAAYAREPPRRIAYIFVRGPDDHGRGEPLAARVVCDAVQDGVAPSDHYGVLAEISISR